MNDRARQIRPTLSIVRTPERRRLAHPEDTTDLEARALTAINEAQTLASLAESWAGILLAFRVVDADMPRSIEARYLARRPTLNGNRHWWSRL